MQSPVLEALRRGPLPLHAVAHAIDRSPSATLRQLQRLVDEGRVTRTGQRQRARYAIAGHIEVDAAMHMDGRPIHLQWSAPSIDWMFPLASRCQHRERIESLLHRAFDRNLLHASSVVVFGSAARWDARPGSDTDVLVLTDRPAEWKEQAIDIDVETQEAMDLVTAPRFEAVPASLQRSILAEGVTVFSSTSPPWFVESLRHDG